MKKKLLFAGIGLAALIVAGLAYVGSLSNKMAITKVIDERDRAWNASLVTTGEDYGAPETTLDENGFLVRLKKIDTSGCPLPFRQSFLNYEQVFERRNQDGSISRMGVGLAKLAKLAGEAHGRDVASAEVAADDYQAAWQKVQSAALQYGVTVSN